MDREKVIKGFEVCLKNIDQPDCPNDCPYLNDCSKYENRVVFQPLMYDALALLKEQENCENCAIAIEDRQPVVRCKDCKHGQYEEWDNGEYVDKTVFYDGYGIHKPDWFCADGKPKEGKCKKCGICDP